MCRDKIAIVHGKKGAQMNEFRERLHRFWWTLHIDADATRRYFNACKWGDSKGFGRFWGESKWWKIVATTAKWDAARLSMENNLPNVNYEIAFSNGIDRTLTVHHSRDVIRAMWRGIIGNECEHALNAAVVSDPQAPNRGNYIILINESYFTNVWYDWLF